MILLCWSFFEDLTDAHAAGVILRDGMLSRLCGLDSPRIERTSAGKPYLSDVPTVTFSVSHTDRLAVCAVSFPGIVDPGEYTVMYAGADSPEVGVDAEIVREAKEAPRLRRIAARFFPAAEAERISLSSEESCPRDFCEVWTACESFVKMTGEGFGRGFRELCLDGVCLPMRVLHHGGKEYIVRVSWREQKGAEIYEGK
jgi:phosphopantetheinyl transferase